MSKPELLPVDLARLEGKAQLIKLYIEAHQDDDRSEEYRQYMLEKAGAAAEALVHEFRHYFDTYSMGGVEPYGLSEKKDEK